MQLTEKELGLPWKVEFREYGGYDSMSDSWDIKNERGSTVVFVDQDIYGQGVNQRPFKSKDAENRAAFIASAANSHHALLRALKELYDAAGLYSTRHPDHVAAMNGAAKVLRDAGLLAAEGKVQP